MRPMHRRAIALLLAAGVTMSLTGSAAAQQVEKDWAVHSMDRPKPRVVDPGPYTTPVPPPSDAVVLFDGSTLDRWRSDDSTKGPARWRIANGYLEVTPGAGPIATTQGFGDVQLHFEWMAPSPARGTGQDRGNSGIFLMGRYEVQVLDSYRSDTYADGQAGALYGQSPPLVNASRPPGQWQTYDIIFRRPRFDAEGRAVQPARMTVIHNGVLIQDAVALTGPTAYQQRPPYTAHPDELPIGLQDHGHPVRFRNIWLRRLEGDR